MSTRVLLAAALVFAVGAGGVAFAADAERREQGSHEHGHGRMNVVLDGGQIGIELEMPADNIVGFEHLPQTPGEKETLAAAARTLKDGAALFSPTPAAGCAVESAEVSSAMLDGRAGADGHADFDLGYTFRCAHPEKLTGIDVTLFKHFPGVRELDVQAVGPKGQTGAELKPGASRLSF